METNTIAHLVSGVAAVAPSDTGFSGINWNTVIMTFTTIILAPVVAVGVAWIKKALQNTEETKKEVALIKDAAIAAVKVGEETQKEVVVLKASVNGHMSQLLKKTEEAALAVGAKEQKEINGLRAPVPAPVPVTTGISEEQLKQIIQAVKESR